jgi:hypothetical protein
MNTGKHFTRSQLFLVRLWPDEERGSRTGLCGSVQHPVSGKAQSFQGCAELIEVLLAMLPEVAEPAEDRQPGVGKVEG